jgi:hypothetical protein
MGLLQRLRAGMMLFRLRHVDGGKIIAGFDPAIHRLAKKMDPRVMATSGT